MFPNRVTSMADQFLKSLRISPLGRWLLTTSLTVSVSGCNWVEMLSVSSTGEQANQISFEPSVSADGRYVTFLSAGTNLVIGDTNSEADIFVRDTLLGTTTLISVDSAEAQGNDYSGSPSISADGRYVAFYSKASNLVVGDTNNTGDIFVRDTLHGTTFRASVGTGGLQTNASSRNSSISGDGRYVAFTSSATNLVAGDTNNVEDVFVRDILGGTTTRISVDSAEDQANRRSEDPTFSSDGRYVAFRSDASNLVTGDTNGTEDIFVRDTIDGTTTRISVDSAGVQGNIESFSPSLSGDGRYVAFGSLASNLVAGDTNNAPDIFVRDTLLGTTTLISVDSMEAHGNGRSNSASISGDGRYVAFHSIASNLVAGDTNNTADIFVRDTLHGTTSRASLDALGGESNGAFNGGSVGASISSDGRYVAYHGDATNLVAQEDLNGTDDIFMRAIPDVSVTSIIPDHLPIGATTSVTITGTNFLPGAVPKVNGAVVSNIVVIDENTVNVDVAVPADAPEGAQNLDITLPGTGPGLVAGSLGSCADCVILSPPGC